MLNSRGSGYGLPQGYLDALRFAWDVPDVDLGGERAGVTAKRDILVLLAEIERLRKIEEAAQDVLRWNEEAIEGETRVSPYDVRHALSELLVGVEMKAKEPQ